MEDKRARKINDIPFEGHAGKPVIYWMSRETRESITTGDFYILSRQPGKKWCLMPYVYF